MRVEDIKGLIVRSLDQFAGEWAVEGVPCHPDITYKLYPDGTQTIKLSVSMNNGSNMDVMEMKYASTYSELYCWNNFLLEMLAFSVSGLYRGTVEHHREGANNTLDEFKVYPLSIDEAIEKKKEETNATT